MQEKQINQYIRKYTDGELTSFSELYDKYNHMIRSVLYKFTNQDELEDLMQDVFLKIFNGLPKFKGSCQLKTWIYRVAYNLALDHIRKKKLATLELMPERISSGNEEKTMMNTNLVQTALQKLNEEHRSVLVLHCMEGLSIDEVSEIVHIPKGTVKSRIHHAKIKMHDILTRSGVSL